MMMSSGGATKAFPPSRATTQNRKHRANGSTNIVDLLKERRAETELCGPRGESAKISISEVLGGGPSIVPEYTVIECNDSLVVINALTGLSPK